MTFLELQNDVLSDRFSETMRARAKNWINFRYGRLWAAEDWSFRYTNTTANVSANASTIPLGTLQRPIAIWDTTQTPFKEPLDSARPEVFYTASSSTSGTPVGFTVVGSNIILNQPVGSTRSYQVFGELAFVPLALDADVPLIPSEFHLMLSSAAVSEGLRVENDPSWQGAENDFQAAYEDMKKSYLAAVRTYGGAYPAWSPGCYGS